MIIVYNGNSEKFSLEMYTAVNSSIHFMELYKIRG